MKEIHSHEEKHVSQAKQESRAAQCHGQLALEYDLCEKSRDVAEDSRERYLTQQDAVRDSMEEQADEAEEHDGRASNEQESFAARREEIEDHCGSHNFSLHRLMWARQEAVLAAAGNKEACASLLASFEDLQKTLEQESQALNAKLREKNDEDGLNDATISNLLMYIEESRAAEELVERGAELRCRDPGQEVKELQERKAELVRAKVKLLKNRSQKAVRTNAMRYLVFEKIRIEEKGVIQGGGVGDISDRYLFKQRAFPECQFPDCQHKKTMCKLFDAVNKVIEQTVSVRAGEGASGGQLRVTKSSVTWCHKSQQHVVLSLGVYEEVCQCHRAHLSRLVSLIQEAQDVYDEETAQLTKMLDERITKVSEQISKNVNACAEAKKYDPFIYVMKAPLKETVDACLQQGVDIVVCAEGGYWCRDSQGSAQ
eukprot:TRINITY_DN4244_c0_g1_i7.p1 TRINITY_DN4244_c0_g1~~TRINITY_DN4244_c0_g1_i7.p1  ORF type:complete len:427 (+),score=89.25 TRINITY_DN4244_c0_g1_i7:133-1413(+)